MTVRKKTIRKARALQRPARAKRAAKARHVERKEIVFVILSTPYGDGAVQLASKAIDASPYTATALAAFAAACDQHGQTRIADVIRSACSRVAAIESGEL